VGFRGIEFKVKMTKTSVQKQQQESKVGNTPGARAHSPRTSNMKSQLNTSKSVYPTNQQGVTAPNRMKSQIDSKGHGRPYPTAALMAASKLQRGPNGKFLPRNHGGSSSATSTTSSTCGADSVQRNDSGPCENLQQSSVGGFSSNHGPSYSYYPSNAPGMRMF
jgi:hypothetical protein